MIRRKYNAPEMNVIEFQAADIITASTDEFDGEWVTLGDRTPADKFFG